MHTICHPHMDLKLPHLLSIELAKVVGVEAMKRSPDLKGENNGKKMIGLGCLHQRWPYLEQDEVYCSSTSPRLFPTPPFLFIFFLTNPTSSISNLLQNPCTYSFFPLSFSTLLVKLLRLLGPWFLIAF